MIQRINGFEQIKGFYSWAFENQELGIKPQHVSIYLFLINQNNRNNWVEWFKLPFDLAMAGSCISSKKTYYACLKDLQDWKLIKYRPGVNNWKSPLIKLEVLKDTTTVPQSEPLPIQADIPQHIQALIQAAIPQPIPNIKLLTYNLKPITDNLQQILDFLGIEIKDGLPDEDKEHSNICLYILAKFNFSEIKNPDKLRKISEFVKRLKFDNKFQWFAEQAKSYWMYKQASGDKTQSLETFIDGGWDRENWTEKLKKEKHNGTNKQKPDLTNLTKLTDEILSNAGINLGSRNT